MAEVKKPEPKAPSMPFGKFVEDVWLPLCVRDGSYRLTTTAKYTNILKIILSQLDDLTINEIMGIRISQYLRWLCSEYRKPDGMPLAEKSIKYHYNILGPLFGYAENGFFNYFISVLPNDTKMHSNGRLG